VEKERPFLASAVDGMNVIYIICTRLDGVMQ
jgi:hypothetical protein